MNRFHPVYHTHTYVTGSRVDIERVLEPKLLDDPEDLIDQFSEPPHFFERLSPVSTHLGDNVIKGRNWTDMMLQCYRAFGKIFTRSTVFLRTTLENNYCELGMVPFTSLSVDPDTLARLLERDYEVGDNAYGKLMELFQTGVIAPCVMPPFHAILPLLPRPFDRRFVIRLAFQFYRPILRAYENYLDSINENQMVIGFWAPEAALTHEIINMIYEEFRAFCAKNKFRKPHLVLLMNAGQAQNLPLDSLMKHWCKPNSPEVQKETSVIFRDETFSDWMTNSHPSVKKMIDRTIAKVDGVLSENEVDYIWSHFESLEALTSSQKAITNLEQRILKLSELGYLALSPDVFIRRKLSGAYGTAEEEPLLVTLLNRSPWFDPWGEESRYGRWRGWGWDSENKCLRIMPDQPYIRRTRKGTAKCPGSPCWKIAWNVTRDACLEYLTGKPNTLAGGIFELLAGLTGAKAKDAIRQNVEDFLLEYGHIYWREHFIQHDMSEADIRLDDIVAQTLRRGTRKPLTIKETIAAACAAQAYFFALDSYSSYAMDAANFDQRYMFQNSMMLTLAFCNLTAAHHYLDNKEKAKEVVDVLQRELIDFQSAYDRHKLEQEFHVERSAWEAAIKSEIGESKMNVVERAARRTAARQLRNLGFKNLFTEDDEELTTNTGHNWVRELDNSNYRWANMFFCGVSEE